MTRARTACLLSLYVGLIASPLRATEPGKAVGSVTISGSTTTLAFATLTKKENLFDGKKQDTVVVLSDKPLGATAPDDEIGLSMRARTGEIVVLALRIDGSKLVNVQVSHKALAGLALLPGAWFQYTASKPGVGSLKLSPHDFDGRSYAADVEFAAAPAARAAQAPAPAPTPALAAPSPKSAW